MPSTLNLNRRNLMLGASVTAAAYIAACSKASTASAQNSIDLTGVSILITGCSSGFGRLGAEHYARLGAKVIATMRNLPRPEATELETLAKSDGLDITVLEIDVTDDAQVTAGVEAALKAAGGKLDVLINNAGMSIAGPIEGQDMTATKLIFDTNVFGAQRMARAVLPSMRAHKQGYIFNITSQLGRVIIPGFGQYSPTKFALEAMSEQMAYELEPFNIDVTIIQPGGYPTRIWYNQNAPSAVLKSRMTEDVIDAYPQFTAGMGKREAGGGEADPMDIPRAISTAISQAQGTRPLRIAIHPEARPQEAVNKVSKEVQLDLLGETPMGPAVKSILD